MAAAVTPSRGGVSPSSSPRLPSPPPMPELQFGPQSPLTGTANEAQVDAGNKPDESARRRIRPGTKAADMVKGPPLVPLNQVDSAFPLQEHLKALYAHLTHGQNSTHTEPVTRESALQIARPPQLDDGETADRNLWLYEICRFLTTKAGLVSCALMEDNPPCSSSTCPEMRASEWQYLCAVHEPPKSCCAIDYVNHTLDWAANVLTSTKHFPSRLQLGGGESGSAYQSMRQLTNIFRRVYRIFAHAWFQHREVFWHIENTHGIYMLFKTVCDEYHLIPEDNYTIPPEAEGPREESEGEIAPTPTEANAPPANMQILRKDTAVDTPNQNGTDENTATSPSKEPTPAQTARRHRHTPSTGSHVTTIAEGTEEEDDVPPVPPITATVSATDLDSPSTSTPTVASPGRKAREGLGRINIGGLKDPQPGHPTPTTMDVSNPLAAAGADATASATTTASKPDPAQPAKLDTSAAPAAAQPKPVSERDRRGSEFESEVRSPGGGSIRTAGPDLLGAILGHMDDKEREEALAAHEVVAGGKDSGSSPATAVVSAVVEDEEKGEDTVLFVGDEVKSGKEAQEKGQQEEVEETGEKEQDEPTATGDDEDASKPQEVVDRAATDVEKEKEDGEQDNDDDDDNDDDEDEDGNETMEEIKLPDREPKSTLPAAADEKKGDEAEENEKDKENEKPDET